MLEPTVNRFGRPVRSPRVIKIREDVRPSPIQCVREFPKLNEPGRCGLFHGIDQLPEPASAIAREFGCDNLCRQSLPGRCFNDMTTEKPRKRQFTDEFKADAEQLVVQSDRPIAQVAGELEINESSLGYWVKAYRSVHPDPKFAPTPVDAARVARLEAENRRLAEENGVC